MAITARPSETSTHNAGQQRPRPSERSPAREVTPETVAPLEDISGEQRATLAHSVRALVHAGFGLNSTFAEGVVSMQRAWQGPADDAVMVDAITLDIHGGALAVREGPTGNPVWGPERGEWSAVVTAILAQPAPQGYARVAARDRPPDAEEPVTGHDPTPVHSLRTLTEAD